MKMSKNNKISIGILIGLLIGVLITAIVFVLSQKPSNIKLFDSNIEKVVEIRSSNDNESWGYATGCFLDSSGKVLTNRHVVKSSNSENMYEHIEVRTASSDVWEKAEIVEISINSDLAILKIDVADTQFFKLAKNVDNGEKIFSIGNPNGYGLSFFEGVVSSEIREVRILEDNYLMMQTSFVINGGNSGAPIFNDSGKLVALMSLRLRDNMNEVIQGVSFAVPLSEMQKFIK